jgi:hypothetical protein
LLRFERNGHTFERIEFTEEEYKPTRPEIPKLEERDYKATIIVLTPSMDGYNFTHCQEHLKANTPGEHRLVVVNTLWRNHQFAWSRENNLIMKADKEADYFILMNDDIWVKNNIWLEQMVECARTDPKIAEVGALLLYPKFRLIQHAGGMYQWDKDWENGNDIFPCAHRFRGEKYDKVIADLLTPTYVPWNTGALLLITRQALKKVGYLDETFLNHFDDIQYGYRAWQHGMRCKFCPTAIAEHRESVTRIQTANFSKAFIMEHSRKMIETLKGKEAVEKVVNRVEELNQSLS